MTAANQKIAAILADKKMPAAALFVLLLSLYGTELLDWEADTLIMEVHDDFNVTLPQVNRDKVWALATVLTTNLYYQSLEAFTHITSALNDRQADFQNYDLPGIFEICWALAVVELVNPPEENETFSPEILAYIVARLDESGFQKVPKFLNKFVSLPDKSETISQNLAQDPVTFEAYWRNQQRRLLDLDEEIRQRLAALIDQVTRLPLEHADPQALTGLRERAAKALGAQQRETAAASATVPHRPVL